MGMTMTEKILAAHCGASVVRPGQYIWASVDGTALSTGSSGLVAIRRLEKLGVARLFDPERVYVVDDHLAPAPSVEAANAMAEIRHFVKKYGITHFFDWGRHGILHELFPNHGYVSPGDFIASVDSHSTSYGCFNAASCPLNEELILVLALGKLWLRVPESIKFVLRGRLAGAEGFVVGKDVILHLAGKYGTDVALYKSIEFVGPAVHRMSMASRFSIANMAVELGAKFGIFPCDDKTLKYLDGKMKRPPSPMAPDADAAYAEVHEVDVTDLPPYVARPHDPGCSVPVMDVERDHVRITQAFLGTCTNGRMEDFRMAASVLKGRSVHKDVRLIVTPASQAIWSQCLKEGIWDIFSEAGALVTGSTCGACAGLHMGVLADKDICISSGPRNFRGRMGSEQAEVYLANPATVVASAVAGEIVDPRRYL